MKMMHMRILIVICALAIVPATQAATTPAKAKTQKVTPAATTTTPVKQTNANPTTTGDSATPSDMTNQIGDPFLPSPNAPRAGEQINWDVIASGGGPMSSASFILNGTLGQVVAGESSSPNFALNAGFWQNFGSEFLCGDVNSSGAFDIADVVFLINFIFASGTAPNPIESADVNCTSSVEISDVVYMINYIFAAGTALCANCP